MNRIALLTSLLTLHLATPALAHGQKDARLVPGALVRVQWAEGAARHRQTAGTLLEWRTDSLAVEEGAGVRRLALARVARVDVQVQRSRGWGAARGAWLGTVVGFATGFVIGGVAAAMCEGEMCGLAFIGGPVVGIAAGMPLGTLAGTMNPGRRWQEVAIGRSASR